MAFQTGRTYQVRPLYLSRKDYRAFAKHMLPALEDYVHVAVENIDFESCLSQIQMRVFLTMADDALWRIELKAQWKLRVRFMIFLVTRDGRPGSWGRV